MNGSQFPASEDGSSEAAGSPLTAGQQQLWFIDEFHHGLPAHNLPYRIGLRGELDLAALRRALDELVRRHEPLRTRMPAGTDGRPVAIIDPPGPVRLELADYAGLSRDEALVQLSQLTTTEAVRPFHLAKGWPVRASLVRIAPREHALILVTHQVAFDHASFGIFVRELAARYGAEVAGKPVPGLPAPSASFSSYARAERTRLDDASDPALAELEKYWIDALAEAPATRFPADRPRPLLASHDGAVAAITIGKDTLRGLRALAERAETTLTVVLLAALDVLLYRYTGQTELVVGTAGDGRDQPRAGELIGYLENLLPVRTTISGDLAFGELLEQVRVAADGAFAHQDLPFARIVDLLEIDRDPGRFPVFQTWLACREPVTEVSAGEVTFRGEPAELRASRYDLGFDAWAGDEELRLVATYAPALFDAETVARLLGHFAVLLGGIAAEPGALVADLPVLTEAERHREVTEWNDTARPFPVVCIHEGFEAQAARTPEAIAAEFGAERISYAELNERAGQIAAQLRKLGVAPETLVGVCLPTSVTRLAALLGIWKAGGGYVPLDPGLPAERIGYMIEDTGMSVIVADQDSAASLPESAASVLVLGDGPVAAAPGQPAEPAAPGQPAEPVAAEPVAAEPVAAEPSNVAYVIYTSGSTGQPKGVVVEHQHAVNFLYGMIEAWQITPDSAVLSFAAYTFDVSVMDMFMPLLAGAKVVLAPAETLHSPPRLAALIRASEITFACLPPAVLSLLTGEDFPHLKTLLSAGEELTSELLRSWLRDGLDIYNGYGPTECAIGATFMKLGPATPLPPPIGRPKPNYQAYVLDQHLNPVPVGVTGELHIGGAGVTRGYLNRPELTAERFITDPFRPGGRLYKTGDLVRRRPDGTLVFAGRIDQQVKISGLRVELGEIEAALLSHPEVSQAVVTVTETGGKKQLAGYVRPAAGRAPQPGDLRAHLARTLPGYMIPSHLLLLDELPLTANGKIDKNALPPPGSLAGGAEPVPPRTLLETVLVDLYATILGNERLGAADSFFDAGGNSLQALQLIAELYSALAVDLDVSAVFLNPTPQRLAVVLREEYGFDDAGLDEESIEDLERQLG